MENRLRLDVLIFRENGTWVAQVLQKDMAAHGESPYAALSAVLMVVQGHLNFDTMNRREPFSKLKRAPEIYWQAFQRATPLERPDVPMMPPAVIQAAVTEDAIQAPAC